MLNLDRNILTLVVDQHLLQPVVHTKNIEYCIHKFVHFGENLTKPCAHHLLIIINLLTDDFHSLLDNFSSQKLKFQAVLILIPSIINFNICGRKIKLN